MQGKTHAACGALVGLGAARLIQENALLPDIVPSVEYFTFAGGQIDNMLASIASILFLFLSYLIVVSLFEQAPL